MTPKVFESTALELDFRRFLKRPVYRSQGGAVAATNKTILITGAGGSIGSALACRLIQEPSARLLLLDNSAKRLEALARDCKQRDRGARHIEFLQYDIRDVERMR